MVVVVLEVILWVYWIDTRPRLLPFIDNIYKVTRGVLRGGRVCTKDERLAVRVVVAGVVVVVVKRSRVQERARAAAVAVIERRTRRAVAEAVAVAARNRLGNYQR